MSERYWITGVQLGMLRTVKTSLATRVDIVEEIIDKQFLGTKDSLASESVDKKEYKRVLEENKVLKQALKYLCNQNSITYDCFWKRIKPDKWRDYIAKIIKTE